jgi:alginate O-acetyltransferase complex protein AlgI
MLFNSTEFIFLFLPAAVLLHFTLARWSINAAAVGTTLSSLAFYAWWNPPFVLLPVASILANFWLARRIVATDQLAGRALLIAGIAANLLVLCYFKYTDFLLSIFDGHEAKAPKIPLALSFMTFVQVAFLIYVYYRRISPDLRRYALFVSFFPHLISGPIVRWSSLGRQIEDASRYRLNWDNIALGLTIFTFGLAKKVLVADMLSPHVAGVFDAASRQETVTAAAAWASCFAFTAQIYFDFSGYSDMAVGLGLLFNFRLPINFAAPLRAINMFDFWRRWHITLTRLVTELIYVPLTLENDGIGRRSTNLMFTMVLIGIWHGAGWTFVVWGACNGLFLLVNQAWQTFWGPGKETMRGRVFGWALTFTAFSVASVFFRAADIRSGWHLIKAMMGFGAGLPVEHAVAWDDWIILHGYVTEARVHAWFGATWSVIGTLWTMMALAIAWIVPDTMEIVNYRDGESHSDWRRSLGPWTWRPSPMALGITTILFAAAFFQLNRVSEFLYYQF